MKLLQRGRWPLNIPLGFGGAAISGEGGGYGFGDISHKKSLELLAQAFDAGVYLYDTAPIYGFGLSEKRLGEAFSKVRDKVFLISKSGVTWHSTKRVNMTNEPAVAQKQLEQSLRDLRSDYIDLYMVHWPDDKVDIRHTIEVLAKAKERGMIKHIGLCNTTSEEIELAQEICSIEAVQSQLNLFERGEIAALKELLVRDEISFMSWGTLDKGILSARVDQKRQFDASDCRSWAPWWKKTDHRFKYRTMEKIAPLLESEQMSALEMAVGHNLSYPELDCILCGPKNIEQLQGLLKALERPWPQDDFWKEIREIADESRRYYSDSQ